MKWLLATASAVALSTASVASADAKGCIKGAIVGGVAGHMAGHGKMGAAAGCVIGHHEANKPDPKNANAQAPARSEVLTFRRRAACDQPSLQAAAPNCSNAELFRRLRSRSPEAAC